MSGFSSLAGSHNLIPASVSLHKAENLARDVLAQFPLNASGNALNSALLYPQFQLLLCFVASERQQLLAQQPQAQTGKGSTFARKVQSAEARPLADMLVDLVRDMGLDKTSAKALAGDMAATVDPFAALPNDARSTGGRSTQSGASISYPGKVVLPSQDRPENAYTGTINHSRHAQLMRMDNLFEEVEVRLCLPVSQPLCVLCLPLTNPRLPSLAYTPTPHSQAKVLQMLEPGCDILQMLAPDDGDHVAHDRAALKLTSKPVVIGDAVPVPAICPEPVEQLLQAALAHHNLGSFEEALKFLEAARMQLEDIARRVVPAPVVPAKSAEDSGDEGGEDKDKDKDATSVLEEEPEVLPSMIPLDLELYVTLCKGNVYQSCGDDEQSLLHYMDGWDRAVKDGDRDWEIVCLNSIGTLAYYSLRYNVALRCFGAVALYRAGAYGLNSADTATAWNNEGAAMFCLARRAEARLRFEKGWAVMCNVLGHRAPRSITGWKNLEKSRRASSSLKSSTEGLAMRPDIDRLVLGGTFMVQATVPAQAGAGGKKKGKKKKK